ncbi:MAG: rRNA maturation RNase YbeY [Ignavibacteria bacterium]|nr:rRNA maturation RNase YbeY [Ignavibacteria bacterium]
MIIVHNQHPKRRFPSKTAIRTIETVLKDQETKRGIAVVFVGHAHMRSVNRKFLNHDSSTDVIAFPFRDDTWPDGELYVNLDSAQRQAREYRVAFTEEVRRLLIHGTLHLLGYSDASRAGRSRMRKLEDKYLRMCQ